MLDFLRSSKASVKEDLSANTTNKTADTLRRLRDSHKKVFVQFEGGNVSYACNIGAFNLEHNVIVVSNLCPDIPIASLRKGTIVSVTAHEQGIGVNLECSYLEPLIESQNSALQLKMPKNLGAHSTRNLNSLFSGDSREILALSKHALK